MQPPIERIDVSTGELKTLLEQARQEPLQEDGYKKLLAAVRTLAYVTDLVEKQETSLAELRELLCPATTEKTAKVLAQAGLTPGGEKKPKPERKKPAAGHGRNGAAAYRGAHRVSVPHAFLKAGDPCPEGCGGKVYPLREPGVLVRLKGQAPIAASGARGEVINRDGTQRPCNNSRTSLVAKGRNSWRKPIPCGIQRIRGRKVQDAPV